MARILAIVVTYNAMPWAKRCFDSLEQSTLRPDVLVVDNCSADGTVQFIRDNYPRFSLIVNTENLGFGAANNIGLQRVADGDYDYAYLLNQDAWLEKDTLERLVAADDGSFGILSPVQVASSGRLDRNFSKKCRRFMMKSDAPVVEVPFVMAAHWLIGCVAVSSVGGFSPAFNQYGEDDNYIDRLHYRGLKVGVVRDVKAVHDRSTRKDTRPRRMRLKCISRVVRICNPARSFAIQAVLQPLALVGMSLKNFSLTPIQYIPEFIRRYPEFRSLRQQSRQLKAFLH